MEKYSEIIIPVRLSRIFVQNHKQWTFLYGNDYFGKGCLGQAWQMFGENNTFAIPTCLKTCQTSGKFNDYNPDFREYVKNAIDLIPRNNPIIPLRKIGEGYSDMRRVAPKLFAYMRNLIDEIKYPRITIDWKTPYA